MATVTVSPASFTMVMFEPDVIIAAAGELAGQLGVGDVDIEVEVDETTPLARASVVTYDPVKLHIESGAMEDPRRPRRLSARATADVLGRLLCRVADRRGPFADAPADGELTLAQSIAWDVYSFGRLERLGYAVQKPRWLYHFRNRHGFTDHADRVFEQLWSGTDLSWAAVAALSEDARAASAA